MISASNHHALRKDQEMMLPKRILEGLGKPKCPSGIIWLCIFGGVV